MKLFNFVNMTHIQPDPYCIFYIDNFLENSLYNELQKSFPNKEYFTKSLKGGKNYIDKKSISKMLKDFPMWQTFMDDFKSESVLEELCKITKEPISKARGWNPSKKWIYDYDSRIPLVRKFKYQDLKMKFEFSSIPNGGSYTYHTDSTKKVLSLLLYMPPDGWKEGDKGGTRWFYPKEEKNLAKWANWENRLLNEKELVEFEEEMECIAHVKYKPNRLAGFIKTTHAYHDIPKVECNENVTRNSLNINLIAPKE